MADGLPIAGKDADARQPESEARSCKQRYNAVLAISARRRFATAGGAGSKPRCSSIDPVNELLAAIKNSQLVDLQ